MTELLFEQESYLIRKACFNVYNQMGSGFLEAVYQECLELELAKLKVPFDSQKELCIHYYEYELKQKYIPDFICYQRIIIEIKAVQSILPQHTAQLFNYLKVTGYQLGFLINFSSYPKLDIKRVIKQCKN